MKTMEWIFDHIGNIAISIIALALTYSLVRSLIKCNLLLTIKEIHSAKNERSSWLRWMGTVIVVAALCIAFYQIKNFEETQTGLIVGLVSLAIAGKVTQKAVEKNGLTLKIKKKVDDLVQKEDEIEE